MYHFFLAACIAAFVSFNPTFCQTPLTGSEAAAVESYVTAQMKLQHIPAVSVAIVRSDQLAFSKAFGTANLELNVPAATNSVFRIGSTSKPFIATGIMILVEEGKLSLDDDIAKFFAKAPPSWSGVKLRHLLSHTAGFPRELPGWTSYGFFSEEELAGMIEKVQPATKPGERHEYSNAGYFTLAAIIAKVSGKPWPEFLKARIFEPVGMKATFVTSFRELVPNRTSGYLWQDGTWVNEGYIMTVRPSGGLMSTAEDLARWDVALRQGKVLKIQTLKEMVEPTKLTNGTLWSYGLGWGLEEFRGRRLVSHGGDILGFRAAFMHDVDDNVTVIVLINCESGSAERIAKGVLAKIVPDLALASWKPNVDDQPEIARVLRSGLENIAANKPFGESAAPAFEEALKAVPETSRKALRERLANIKSFEFLREDKVRVRTVKSEDPVDRIRYYRLTTASSVLHYAVYLSAAGKILLFEAILE
jgi:CubicO group peptidase (beta-lactamase class C family)